MLNINMCNLWKKYNLYLLLFLNAINVVFGENEIIDTTHGLVSGKVLKTLINDVNYYGFMGIPFAEPPVKERRFLDPQEIKPWEGVLSVTKEKQACVQFNINVKKGQSFGNYGVEDCLYLDIYTPAPDQNKRATVVFLYNDSFKNSYNKSADYAPDFFIEEDIIVVTISHRLAVFGFLSAEDDILPGNAGLKDIVAGLRWVKNNIERFGGDPKRITLMGWHGGAAAVDLLVHSKARELFNSAILQSGTSLLPAYLQDNIRERAFELAEQLDRASPSSSRLLQDLNEIPVEDLLEKELSVAPHDYGVVNQKPLLTFGPIIEKNPDGLLTEYPENLEQKIKMPVMIGFNSREGLEPALEYLIQPMFMLPITKDFPFIMPIRLNFTFDPLADSFIDAMKEVKDYYFPKKIKVENIPEYVTYIGDVLMSYGVDRTAALYANISESPVYYYHFDYYSDFNENKNSIMKLSTVGEGTWGAATGDELCYLFKCPSLKDKYKKHHKTKSEEIQMQKAMIKMWANFIKYGNPTPSEDNPLTVQWPPYSTDTKEYLHIGKQVKIKRDLYKERFQFWNEFIRKWGRLAKNGVVSVNKHDEL